MLTGSGVTPTYSTGGAAVAVDPGIMLTGPEIETATVSITANFRFGDELSMAPQPLISALWDSYTGVLTLSGLATASDYQAALRSVTFRTTSGDSSLRTVTFAIGNALYNPDTGHFYEFVYSPWIDWYSAEELTKAIDSYGQFGYPSGVYGLQGYLVTVTSQAENDFVADKLQGQGWMGASDEAVEGEWRWVTGPEAGMQFSQQQLGSTGTSVNGMYIHWDVGEPNDSAAYGEHFGHFWENGFWNDYAFDNTNIAGYVVEYGGMAGDPSLQLFAETTVTVSTNTPPMISAVPDQETPHDTVLGPIPFTVGDAQQSADLLTVTGSSSNPSLVPHENITFGGSGANRTVSVTPAAGQSGEAYITMTVTDDEGATTQTTLLLSVPVNYAPVLTNPSSQPALPSIMEDSHGGAGVAVSTLLTGQVSDTDPGDPVGMAVTGLDESHGHWEYSVDGGTTWLPAAPVSSSNALLVPPAGSLRFLPAPDYAGNATIAYRAWDQSDGLTAGSRTSIAGTGGTAAYSTSTQSAIVTVTAVNDGPVLAGPASAVVQEETEQGISGFTLQDVDAGSQLMSLYVSVSHGTVTFSTTNGLLLNAGDYTGSSLNVAGTQTSLQAALHSLTYRGGHNYYGPDSLVVLVSDQGWSGTGEPISVSLTVPITVSNVDDPPSPGGDATVIAPAGGPASVPEDQPMPESPNIRLMVPTLSDPDGQTPTAIRILSVTGGQLQGADGNPIALGTSGTVLPLTGGYLDLRFAPAPDRDSDASFEYVVVDPTEAHVNSAPSVATVPVSPVNDAPTVSPISSQTTAEDQPLDVTLSFQDIDSPAEALSCTAAAADSNLVPGANLTCSITGATTGVLRLTPAPDLSGTTSIQVVLSDGTDQVQTAFDLTVNPVNDPSTISALSDVAMNQDAGPLLLPFALSDSDSDLAGLIPSASSSDPLLFPPGSITFGGVGVNRTVSVTPAADSAGEAVITIAVTDSADNSLSATTTFRVTVRSAPTAPVWNSPAAGATATGTVALSVTSTTYGGAEYAALFEVYGDSGYTDLKASFAGAQVAEGTPSTATWNVDLPRGTYYLRATVTDTWGMSSGFVPLGAVTVNRAPVGPALLSPSTGVLYAHQVSFAATYSDPDGDTGTVHFELFPTSDYSGLPALSLTGTTVNTGEASTVDWEVALPAGTYYLRAGALDDAGAASPPVEAGAITLDRAPGAPTGLTPSSGSWVTTTQPTLSWTHTDPDGDGQSAYQIIIRDGEGNTVLDTGKVSTDVTAYTVDEAVLADASDGYRWTVRTWDTEGVAGPYAADSLTGIDSTQPSASAVINGGSAQTNETGVTLTLSATDAASGLAQMRFATDGGPWSEWEAYTTERPYTLPAGDGLKEVSVQVQDRAGHLSGIASAQIILDTVPPSASASALPETQSQRNFAIHWSGDDGTGAGLGPVKLYYSTDDGTTWTQYGGTFTSSPISFTAPRQALFLFSVRAADAAGNEEAEPVGPGSAEASTRVSLPPPPPSSPEPEPEAPPETEGDEVIPEPGTAGGQVLVAGPGHTQPVTVEQVFGQGVTIQAHLETAGGLAVDHLVQVSPDGTYQTRDLPPGAYRIIFRVASPDGQELAGATAIVTVDQEGVLEMDAPLIDPFGVVTSASTGEPLSGVGLRLFWADTPLNRQQGRDPHTEVILPRLPGFAPNDNANPQATDASGAYAWMVFPDADYYIVAEVDGYERYDSRQEGRDVAAAPGEDSYISDGIVHVGASIVPFDIALQPLHERHDGFVTGYPDGTFRPDQPITRAEVAAVVARLFEFAEDPSSMVGFGDVSDEHWARAHIAALSQRGIMVGFNDGNFHPDQPVTRAELAAVVARLQGLDPQMGDTFADTRGHWAQGVVEAARQAGAVTGFTDGLYHPEEPATRAQFVAMVARLLGRGPLTGLPTPTWPDLSADHWAFGYVEEASADHLFDPLPEGAGEQWAGVPEE